MKKLLSQLRCAHLLILAALLLACYIPQIGTSTAAYAKTSAHAPAITVQHLEPDPTASFELLSTVYTYAQATDWPPSTAPIEQIPIVQRAALTLYRGPANASPHELEPVDFIEPDFETMPDRFLYPLTELPADQRYYLAYTASWQPTPTPSANITQIDYSICIEPGEIGSFHVATNQQNVAFYDEELRFVTDYDTIKLYPTTDATLLNATSSNQTIWFGFATQTDASTADTLNGYHIEKSNADFYIISLGNHETWDLYTTDLTDYLYPEVSTVSSQMTHFSGAQPLVLTVDPSIYK